MSETTYFIGFVEDQPAVTDAKLHTREPGVALLEIFASAERAHQSYEDVREVRIVEVEKRAPKKRRRVK